MNAVTLELADGNTITLMPFATIAVREGQSVAEGAALGTLASGGDVSMAATHLHMGYRQGHHYLDPMSLFGVVPSASQEPLPGMLAAPFAAAGAGVASVSGVTAADEVPFNAGQPQGEMDALLDSSSVEAFEVGTIETGHFAYRPKQSSVSSPFAGAGEAIGSLLSACQLQLGALAETASELAQSLDVPLPALLCSAAAIIGAVAVSLLWGCAKLLAPRIQKLSQARKCGASWQLG